MGYLICEKCEGYYQLQEEEDPDDFKSCECGGKLIFVRNLIDYYGETLDESLIKKDAEKRLEPDLEPGTRKLPVLNMKSLFLGGVVWVALDSLLYKVSIYNTDGIAVFSLLFAQLFGGLVAGYLSGKEIKAGIINGFIVGIFFTIILIILRLPITSSNPSLILMALIGSSTLLAIIGGVIGVCINQKTVKKDENRSGKTVEFTERVATNEDWPKNLAVWLAGLGVLFLFLYFPIFGGILILFSLLIYVSRNFMIIYAFVGAYLGYTFIQAIFGVMGLFYANMSTYETEAMYSFVALTIFNLVVSGYVLYKTRKLDK
ncbi:DUF5518 domain-containing protein [Methanobacterium petrolearium]|uniref:DUF5518 domain-containing protein n=1 Tax=Methanobacterium petrolearium TaxID=710190 RepID=UPI001AEA461E|nr:DUF5518 domain-containing protein [Methanobacterium petrolearium]MBP1946978.1 hypothetical protein [Methanobacterium petrolearium]BDZ71475.1 hypothetical protein GCM10025861_19920 [Methanobacterium petrolearium]